MKVRRQITGALCGLLDTYGSRYSDYDGYWIFGLLAREADSFSFDLLSSDAPASSSSVVSEACRLARVSGAKLTIQKIGDSKVGPVNGHISHGHQVSMVAEAVSDLGKKYRAERFLFVAPHDPSIEHRSARRREPIQIITAQRASRVAD
jgi:hypothetical protein